MIRFPNTHSIVLVLLILSGFLAGCTMDKSFPITIAGEDGYPTAISEIMQTQCATSGCHNTTSKAAAAGLSFSTWNELMQGGRNGAVIIPYRSDQSWTLFFINTFNELGISLEPNMPFNKAPLSKEKVLVIRDWIDAGAPDFNGYVKFSDDANRRKVYVTNQGCDMVTVVDAASQLAMRYIDIGISATTEAPHMIKVDPQNRYWYVVFTAGTAIQKFDARTDEKVGELDVGVGAWNTLVISENGKTGFMVNWEANGSIVRMDLENMQEIQRYAGTGEFSWPHGIAYHEPSEMLYVTAQTGNFVYKIDISDSIFIEKEEISIEPGKPPIGISSLDPHEVLLSPDGSKYFLTCQKTNDVRVVSTENDSVIAIIPTGDFPQEMAISYTTPYLFVTCMEEACAEPKCHGSVAVINYETNTLVKELQYKSFQPHGIAVDDVERLVYVASRNTNPSGPAPHHAASCDGRNGYLQLINLVTLEFVTNYKTELSVDPYSIAVRN